MADFEIIERKLKLDYNEGRVDNTPKHLVGIKVGDVLVVEPQGNDCCEKIKMCKGILIGVSEYITFLASDCDALTLSVSNNVKNVGNRKVLLENGFNCEVDEAFDVSIPFSMLFIVGREKEEEEKVKCRSYSIREQKIDEKIIAEMIAKVDKERLTKIVNICANGKKVKDGYVDKLLKEWATAKYHFYVAFGNNLVIKKKVEYDMDETEMSTMIYDFYRTYPKYAATMDLIMRNGGASAFVKNQMPRIDFFANYAKDKYTNGMKVSKFFNKLFEDETFDIEFSKILQNRTVHGFISVSIDPYDYLTSGTTMHGWGTCQNIASGENAGLFTWLTDESTLVAFRDNGKDYEYVKGSMRTDYDATKSFDFGKNKFTGNSKSWRQLIYCDIDTCAILSAREYPRGNVNNGIADVAKTLLTTVIGINVGQNEWDNYGDIRYFHNVKIGNEKMYQEPNRHHYSDIKHWRDLADRYGLKKYLVAPKDADMKSVRFKLGGEVHCPSCGRKIREGGAHLFCC